MKVVTVIRLALLGKEQFDCLLHKLDNAEQYNLQDEYCLDEDNIADLFVKMLYKGEH